MRSLRRPAAVFIAIALAGGLAACGDDDDDETTGGATTTTAAATSSDAIDIVMDEYSYAISGALKPGGTIRLSNVGSEFHMVGLLKLKDDKTLADVTALLEQFASEGGGEEEGPTTTTADGSGAAATTTTAGVTGAAATTTTTSDATTTTADATTATSDATTTTVAGAEGEDDEGEDPFAELGDEIGAPGAFMGPGQKAEVTVPSLGEGTYAMVCFLPTEGGGPPHFVQGMIGELTVEGEQADEPTADATFLLEAGKAISGPSSLPAGRQVIKYEAVGDAGELEPGLAKLNQGATVADINQAFEAFETEDDFVLPVNAAAQIPGLLILGLFDLNDADEIYVAVDLSPGTYGMDAHDSDVDDPPIDPVEKTTFVVA